MKMDEYLKKKKEVEDQEKEIEAKRKELEDAEKRAQEIKTHLKQEKKKEMHDKLHGFSLLGMKFRPWTLNDMVIILVIVVVLVIGGLSFMPSEEVSSDTTIDNEGFFSRFFGGFAVKSLEDETSSEIEDVVEEDIVEEDTSDDSTDTSSIVSDNEAETNNNLVDFVIGVKYQESSFTTINVTNMNYVWYTLSIKNKKPYDIVCTVNHYVNDELKQDKSKVTIESADTRAINIRELSSDAVDTLSRVKLEVSCSDGVDSSTEDTKVEHLKFYFS